jgi:hypothetical protein
MPRTFVTSVCFFVFLSVTGCTPDQLYVAEREGHYESLYGSRVEDAGFTGKYQGEIQKPLCAFRCDDLEFVNGDPDLCPFVKLELPLGYEPDLESLPGIDIPTKKGVPYNRAAIVHAELYQLSPAPGEIDPELVGFTHIRMEPLAGLPPPLDFLNGIRHEVWLDYHVAPDPNIDDPVGETFVRSIHGGDNLGARIWGSLKINSVEDPNDDGKYDRISALGMFTFYSALYRLAWGDECILEMGEAEFVRVADFSYP